MKHSVDSTQDRERPNLLSGSNRASTPTVDILSSLENRKKLQKGNKFNSNKLWFVVFFFTIAIAVIGFLQFDNLQKLSASLAQSLTPSSTTDKNIKPLVSAKLQTEVIAQAEPPAPSTVDNVKTSLEPSATLIDIPVEKEKTEVSNDSLSNSKMQIATSSDSKGSQPAISNAVGTTSSKSSKKTKTLAQNTPAKKHAIEKGNEVERKNKDALKIPTNADKNSPKTYDNDIALLSALLANTSKSRGELSSNVASTKKPVTASINLDVVERNPGDNTKNLLNRCEKLGGMEAKLCHDRICAGSWQSESACSPSKG